MRICFALLLLNLGLLTGCVYYGDIHQHSHELSTQDLGVHHTYQPALAAKNPATGWWTRFHDPQLNQLITIALQDSPTMQIAEARVREASHIADAASANLWPTLDLAGNAQRQHFSASGLVPPPFNGQTFNIGQLGLNFNYDFDFWGKNRQTLHAKINEKHAAEAEFAESQLVLSTAVAETYFQLINNMAQLNIAKEKWKINNQLYQITNDRMQHGINSDIPVKTILADIQEAKQSVEYYQQITALSRHQLAILLGKNPFTTDIHITSLSFQHYAISLPSSLPAKLLANRPDIAVAKFRAEAAANKVNVAKAFFFPDINLSALYNYQSIYFNELFTTPNRNYGIIGAIDLPIFDAGARRANLKVNYAEYDLAVNEYNQTILTALREVADQESILQSVNSQLKSQNISYDAINHNYHLYLSRYRHGITDYANVLEIKNSLLQEQAAQLTLQTQHIETVVALLKALGGKDA